MSKNPKKKPARTNTVFPFKVRLILEMCWGMTMTLSHEVQQQVLGTKFVDEFMYMFKERKTNPADRGFKDGLLMAMARSLRNMGLIRDNHVQFLNYKAYLLTRKRESIEKAGSFTSFSGSGLYSKIVSFILASFSFGSLADLMSSFKMPETFILFLILAGVAGTVVVTSIFKAHAKHTEETWTDEITKQQNEYWIRNFKPDMTEQLFLLYLQIKKLIDKFYPGKMKLFAEDDEILKASCTEVWNTIALEILPPNRLIWPPWTETPTPPQGAIAIQTTPQGVATPRLESS
jgi:hypothetical protein